MTAQSLSQRQDKEAELIGYFVPEFPGQTHIMFWREVLALDEAGIDVALVSTRKPHGTTVAHTWAPKAMGITTYLHPASRAEILGAYAVLKDAGLARLVAIIRKLVTQADASIAYRLRCLVYIYFAARLADVSRKEGWRHVHVGSCGSSALIARLASEFTSITYSLSLLGPRLDTYGPGQALKWSRAAFGLFQSEALLAEARDRVGSDLPAHIAVAPVGVNVDYMRRTSAYEPWNGHGACRIYSCGRLNPVKGYADLIEAAAMLKERGLDISLRIAGEDEAGGSGYRRVLEALIKRKNLGQIVTLLGTVSEETNREEYRAAHIYAMASRDEAAGAVAAMEAMSIEVPVVMTRAGATAELIDDGIDGLLVEPQCPELLADAIVSVAKDPQLARRLGQAGRSKIERKYHHRRSALQIVAFLDLGRAIKEPRL